MTRTKAQNKKIRDAARDKLLQTAITLFAQEGYANTSIRKIAKHADVSIGLLYHYFENKENLLDAVFLRCMETLSMGFAGIENVPTPTKKLVFLLDTIFSTLENEYELWGLFYSLRSQPAVVQILGDGFVSWTKRLRDIFEQLFSTANYPDPKLEAYWLYSLIEGAIQQYLLAPDQYPLQQIAVRIKDQITDKEKGE